MPSKSLTLKFGADTTRLDAALKKLRRGLTRSIGGTARKTAGGLATGFLGGFAGGMFAGGLPGMAQSLFGELMDISPQFATSMMNLAENVRQDLQPQMEDLAETVAKATPSIAQFVSDLVQGAADFLDTVRGEKKISEPGFFTTSGAAAGLKAVGDIFSGEGLFSDAGFRERLGGVLGSAGALIGMTPAAAGLGIDQQTGTDIATWFSNMIRRGEMIGGFNEPKSAYRDEYLRAVYGDEGIAPGTI